MTLFTCGMLSLQSCDKSEDEGKKPVEDETLAKSRTVLIYMVGENSLNQFVGDDLQEMLEGMSDETLRAGNTLLVYVDDIEKPRIYCLTKGNKEQKYTELVPEKQYAEDCNSASADRLAEIIDYMLQYHPAESYGLVLWSHASGWIPSTYKGDKSPIKKSFGKDNGYNSSVSNIGNEMNIPDMARAIESKCQFEYIFFDACFMQCIEADYELRKCAKYIVASPAEIPGPGANYKLMAKPFFKAENSAKTIVDTYYDTYYDGEKGIYRYVDGMAYGIIISAVDTKQLDNFAAYTKTICDQNSNQLSRINYSETQNYYDYELLGDSHPDFLDIQGIMYNIIYGVDYDEWKAEFNKLVVNHKFTPRWTTIYSRLDTKVKPDQCGGVSMFIPSYIRYSYDDKDYINKVKKTAWGSYIWGETKDADEQDLL